LFGKQLAKALSEGGSATGLLDIDVCGPSVPRMVGAEQEEVRQVEPINYNTLAWAR
jgi:Mrp family chromosome partitioning ATPase